MFEIPTEEESFEEGCPDCGADTVVSDYVDDDVSSSTWCTSCGWRE